MTRFIITITLFIFTFSGTVNGNEPKKLPAFPGAEGYGQYATGGRGGQAIYVTNLEDNNNPGSLRWAINQTGARIILFKLSGTIRLKSSLKITNDNITIAGQTAPGDGITLRDYPIIVDADNVVIRFMRFRMGDVAQQEADALGGRFRKNIIIDHCSMSWGTDECASFYDNENFTLQWSIISESLRNSVHEKGEHGYGGIWGGRKASFHHNLFAHHDSRNPRFCGSRYSNKPNEELVDYRNNVIFNWGGNSAYAAEGGRYNLINNYYKAGPATPASKTKRIIQTWTDNGENNQPKGTYGTFYVEGNYMTESMMVTENNWDGVDMSSSFSSYAPGVAKNDLKSDAAYPIEKLTTHTAEMAYEKILDFGGACLNMDSVDQRILHELETGTPTYTDGGNGSSNGLVDTQNAVGGWPQLKSEDAPEDSDSDGMPNIWETANGLNPKDPSDAQLKTVDGTYPNIEVYINSLVSHIIESQNQDGIVTSVDNIFQNSPHEKEINIFMNAVTKELTISHQTAITDINIYSVNGQLLLNKTLNQENIKIPVISFKNGIYIVSVRDSNYKLFSNKIVVLNE